MAWTEKYIDLADGGAGDGSSGDPWANFAEAISEIGAIGAPTNGDAVWSAHGVAGPGSNDIEFAFPTASADWGVASGVVITDSATPGAGNVLLQGALTTPKTIESGDTFRFSVGNVEITLQ